MRNKNTNASFDSLTGCLVNGIRIVNWDEDRGPDKPGECIHAVLHTSEKSREKTIASLKDQLDLIEEIRIIRTKTAGFVMLLKKEIYFIAWSGADNFNGIENVPISFFVLGGASKCYNMKGQKRPGEVFAFLFFLGLVAYFIFY